MKPARPNILLVTTDQQRYDASGGAGPTFLRTPHYDLLRREGITFTSAYADCPICVPSRVSIMTGLYVFSHGMNDNGDTSKVMPRDKTLPGRLRALGYQTAAIGKMHFTPERARHGFDEMILPADYYREMDRSGHPYRPMHHGLGQNELYPGMATVPESLTLTSWTAEKCVEYIRERRDPTVPFFLWCSFSKPHPPLDPPEPYYSMYRNCEIPDPVYGDWCGDEKCPEAIKRFRQSWSLDLIPPEIIREARTAYYGLITQTDYNMGRVFAALQDMNLFNDTLILYTSDHGEFLGDHRTGAKSFFYEPSAHIPMVLRLPKYMDDRHYGETASSVVTLADILPTLVSGAGGRADDVDGQDLTALARGQLENPRQYLEATISRSQYFAITDGRWKYIYYPEGGAEQLFDLQNDPKELKNLAYSSEYRSRRDELLNEMVQRHESRQSPHVKDGRFTQKPIGDDTEKDRRDRAWPGLHTEFYHVDVRH